MGNPICIVLESLVRVRVKVSKFGSVTRLKLGLARVTAGLSNAAEVTAFAVVYLIVWMSVRVEVLRVIPGAAGMVVGTLILRH